MRQGRSYSGKETGDQVHGCHCWANHLHGCKMIQRKNESLGMDGGSLKPNAERQMDQIEKKKNIVQVKKNINMASHKRK